MQQVLNGMLGSAMVAVALFGPMWMCYAALGLWIVAPFAAKLMQPVTETIDHDQ